MTAALNRDSALPGAAIPAGGPLVTPQAGYVIPPGGRLLLEGPAVNAWAVTGAGTATVISWLTTLMMVI